MSNPVRAGRDPFPPQRFVNPANTQRSVFKTRDVLWGGRMPMAGLRGAVRGRRRPVQG